MIDYPGVIQGYDVFWSNFYTDYQCTDYISNSAGAAGDTNFFCITCNRDLWDTNAPTVQPT